MFSSATILREIEKIAPPRSNATKISSVFSLRAEERRERRRRSYDGADTRDRSNVQTIIISPHKNWSPPFREGRRATREREEKGRRTHQELKQVIAVFVGEVKEREKRSIAHTRGVSKSKRQNESLKNPFDDDVNDRTTKKVVSFPFNEDRSKKTTQSKKKKKKKRT